MEKLPIQPVRVMLLPDYAESPNRVDINRVAVIFVRQDGWALGCPMSMVFWAHRTWADHWATVWCHEVSGWVEYAVEVWREQYFGPKSQIRFSIPQGDLHERER